MMHVYMDLKEGDALIRDEEGIAVADLPSARHLAVTAARGVMREELAKGTLLRSAAIIVRSGNETVLLELPFVDAITVER